MKKELIINSTPSEVEIAMLEGGKLVELHRQKTNTKFSVGDVFLGTIKKTMPGLNAAFVDIGHRKDAFLHYTDLGPNLRSLLKFTDTSIKGQLGTHRLDNFKREPEIIKTGKINQVLQKRQNILVQVLKEPISTKGPRLSCELTIPGRYMVMTPFSDVIAISKKIANKEERKRLQVLVESIRPKGFGIIVRTAAEGKKVADLHEELRGLLEKWERIHNQLRGCKPPAKLLSEADKASTLLRDVLNESFNNVVVNDSELYGNVKSYLENISPEQTKILSLHRSKKSIFEAYSVNRQIKAAFGKTATMSSGAYLVIEHTEAMHVIDVNSGPKHHRNDQEEAAIAVNLEAAEEIARQLRLRDIGGLIIIDFIDMKSSANKQKLVSAMRDFMKLDRAQHTILQLSKFGLMQITRQRTRPEVKIDTSEKCSTCGGTGKQNASILIVDNIERDLEFIVTSRPQTKIQLKTHPFIAAYLTKGWFGKRWEWYKRYNKWIKVQQEPDYDFLEYRFFDQNQDEIRLN